MNPMLGRISAVVALASGTSARSAVAASGAEGEEASSAAPSSSPAAAAVVVCFLTRMGDFMTFAPWMGDVQLRRKAWT